jgi:hypothetical protein
MSRLTAFALALALAACHGKTAAPTTPENTEPTGDTTSGGRVAGNGTVVGDASLYAKLQASSIKLPAGDCSGEAATLGAQVDAWQHEMGGPIAASCDGAHCHVELDTPPDESCDTDTEDGCDGSAYVIEFELDAAGAIVADSLTCTAAG